MAKGQHRKAETQSVSFCVWVTWIPGRPRTTTHASIRRPRRRWDDWENLAPYYTTEVEDQPQTPLEAMRLLREGVDGIIRILEDE